MLDLRAPGVAIHEAADTTTKAAVRAEGTVKHRLMSRTLVKAVTEPSVAAT
ncbi:MULTISPECIES: hypothetical protein [unclassified Amycolatopsis]|uniref:hypothetical protein n=1 Tax=unclassified Amycolatopsis TaxID=2618356 RepID=UPI001431B8AB|nr:MULTISPECIES: hypothetical protein [unclassified Amycolatopsis]